MNAMSYSCECICTNARECGKPVDSMQYFRFKMCTYCHNLHPGLASAMKQNKMLTAHGGKPFIAILKYDGKEVRTCSIHGILCEYV